MHLSPIRLEVPQREGLLCVTSVSYPQGLAWHM